MDSIWSDPSINSANSINKSKQWSGLSICRLICKWLTNQKSSERENNANLNCSGTQCFLVLQMKSKSKQITVDGMKKWYFQEDDPVNWKQATDSCVYGKWVWKILDLKKRGICQVVVYRKSAGYPSALVRTELIRKTAGVLGSVRPHHILRPFIDSYLMETKTANWDLIFLTEHEEIPGLL